MTGVNVSPATSSVVVGKTQQLSVTVQPSNATDKALTWASNDTSVATVSAAGLVTAKKVGTATVTAKARNGVNGTCKVTVTPAVNLQITEATMPTGTLTPGKSFVLRGVVSSNYSIDWVNAGVYTSSGAATAQVKTVYPGTTSCDIKTTLDSSIKFGQLGVGSYVYRVTAMSCGLTKTLVESSFTIAPPNDDNIMLQSVYYTQVDDGCYIATVAMAVANYDLLCGRTPNTYATVLAANGGSTHMSWSTPEKFGLHDANYFVSSTSGISSDAKVQKIIEGLRTSPYGLFANFRDTASTDKDKINYTHAVLIIGFQDGNIIINDPARNKGGERIPLTSSRYLTEKYKTWTGSSTATQAQMLTHLRVLTKFVPTT